MDWLIVCLFVVGIAAGWFLGRYNHRKRVSVSDLPTSAIRSLTEIINQETDVGIDQFIEDFQVSAKTFDTHMALGNASRKRGEIEKAIKLHQNLMSRPNLSRQHQDQACLELGRDYLQAGLLDRAESLFQEVIRSDAHNKREAQLLLLALFEDEHEWEKAITLAQQLLGKRKLIHRSPDDHALVVRVSQLYCELAEQHIEQKTFSEAQQYIDLAQKRDKSNSRVGYLRALVAIHQGEQKLLNRLLPDLLDVSSPVLYASLWMVPAALRGRPKAEAIEFFEQLYSKTQSIDVLQLMCNFLGSDDKVFRHLLSEHIENRPSVPALAVWVELNASANRAPDISWAVIQKILPSLNSYQKRHRCRSCGFSSKQLFWRCPSCKTWDSMDSISGEDLVK